MIDEEHPTSDPDACQQVPVPHWLSWVDLTGLPTEDQDLQHDRIAGRHGFDFPAIIESSLPLELILGDPQPPGREPEGRGCSTAEAKTQRHGEESSFEEDIRAIARECEKTHPGSVEFAEKLLSAGEAVAVGKESERPTGADKGRPVTPRTERKAAKPGNGQVVDPGSTPTSGSMG